MAYVESTLIIDGALAEVEIWTEGQEERMEAWEAGIQALGKMTPQTVEIFSLYHPHREGFDCNCVEYETDHHPKWSNKDA